MKKMKLSNQNLLLILALMIAALLVVYFTGKTKRTGDLPQQFIPFKSDEILSMEILPAHQEAMRFKIEKKDGKWYVIQNKIRMLADSAFVDRALAEIDKLFPSQLAGSGKDSWKDFGVDSSGTLLILTAENGIKAELVIGNMTFQDDIYVSSYVRIPGENKIFTAECYLEGTIKASLDSWREKKMFNPLITLNSVTISLDENLNKQELSLIKEETNWKKGNQVCDSALINKLLRNLENINHLPLHAPTLLPDFLPLMKIRLGYARGEPAEVSIYPEKNQFLIASSVNLSNYLSADSAFIYRLRQSIEALMK